MDKDLEESYFIITEFKKNVCTILMHLHKHLDLISSVSVLVSLKLKMVNLKLSFRVS